MKYLFILIFIAFSITGCDTSVFFEKNYRMEQAEWNYLEKPEFAIDIDDTASSYAAYVNIRFEPEYTYSNLFFLLNMQLPDGTQKQERVECELFDKEGLPLGKGLGDLFFIRYRIPRMPKFNQSGTYHFQLEQNMRVDHLKGIHDIGMRVEKVK